MRNVERILLGSLLSALVLAMGCSSDKSGGGGGGGSGGGTATYENNGDGVCSPSVRPANDDFCWNQCTAEASCKDVSKKPVESCCVLVGEPGRDAGNRYLVRTTTTKEYADPSGAPPNLGCFDPAGYPAKPPANSSKTATLKGILKVFANGGCTETDLDGVKIEVYTVKRTGDPATDGGLDQLVGTPIVISAEPAVPEEVKNKCVDGQRFNREYSYENVPMYTELVVKTTGAGWTPFYAYNVYVSDTDPDFDSQANSYDYTVRALAEDDFATIPTVAIGTTITAGNAAIGGEVHDCDNIRLRNARVDISLPRKGLEYFNSDEDNPLPESGRRDLGTGVTALYSALDVPVSGPEGSFARVAGTGLIQDGDKERLVSLGYFDVRAYPDSVTSVSLRGLRPFQVP